MDKLARLALETAQLPSLPELVKDLQRLIDRNEDIHVIADLLATDAALVVRVIELANSAFYGHHNISRIFEAVNLIGLKRISLFVRTAYTIDLLKSVNGISIDMSAFWTRSFVAGLISQNIAEKVRYPQPDSLYTAGLMMYIGEIIMALLPISFRQQGLQENRLASEQLALWGFPELLVEAIRYYHEPSASPDQYALPVSIVHLTDCLVHGKADEVDDDALLVTHLNSHDIHEISQDFQQVELYK
jgi:HD-like signal output (HDOD) protein